MQVQIRCPQLAARAARLRQTGVRLPALLAPANDAIIGNVLGEVAIRYGKHAHTFESHQSVFNGGATVSITTDDQKTLWYEYGTRPHTIAAKNAKVLRFNAGGQVLFRPLVHHPGTVAHNQRDAITTALRYTAAIEWRAALYAALKTP